MGRRKLPEDPRRKQQVSTFLKRYGRQGYRHAGSLGGKKSPSKFSSETASKAIKARWDKKRAQELAERKTDDEEQS